MRKNILIVIAAIIVLAGFLFLLRGNEDSWLCVNGQWVKHGNPGAPEPTKPCQVTNFEECIASECPILESYPRQCKTPEGRSFTEDIGNEIEKSDLIRVSQPRPGQVVSSPLEISGQARGSWYFEASFPILLVDQNGQTIAQTIAQAQSEWMTEEFVPFKATLTFSANLAGKTTLVFKKDNPSGLPEHDDQLIMPIFLQSQESMKIKVFFNNSQLDPDFSCNKVFPVERTIVKTQAVARAALEELLRGTTQTDELKGFFTSINSGVKIQKLTIEKGIAKVDFDKQIEYQVGGSCRVGSIRAEIEQTLKQFSTVKEVIISIDGRTDDILQP